MIRILPETWSSVILTVVFATVVYFVVYWIRLKEEDQRHNGKKGKSIFGLMKSDIVATSNKLCGKKNNKGKKEKPKESNEPHLRRGGSSNELISASGEDKNEETNRNKGISNSLNINDTSIRLNSRFETMLSDDEKETPRASLRRVDSMKSFFSPMSPDCMTPGSLDSASPFPQEYDQSNEIECQFLRDSSLNTRGEPQYMNVMSQMEIHPPKWLVNLFSPVLWVLDHRPLCWIRNLVVDIIVAHRIEIILKPIASNMDILKNPHISNEIDRLVAIARQEAIEKGNDPVLAEKKIMKTAETIINKMASCQTPWVLRLFYCLLSAVLRTIFRVIHVDQNGLNKFHEYRKSLGDDIGVVFLPTHKSHIDYLILSYVSALYTLPVPVIAAGDNLNIPIIGALFRYSGAFFMRRSLGNDSLYRVILEGYLEEVLKSGSTLEFFVEGGRSRDGTILPPKYGLLNVILDAVKAKRLRDVILVPIAVDYEHCPDIGSYVTYMMGGKKQKESLMGLVMSARSILSTDCGDAYVTLGTPMSLCELLKRMEIRDATLDVRHEVKYVGAHVCQAMRNNSVITSSTLAATAFLDFPQGQWVSEAELSVRMDVIKGWLRQIGAFEGYSKWSATSLHRFIGSFPDCIEYHEKAYRPKQDIREQITLFYYRNGLLHHFLADATVLHVFRALQISSGNASLSLVDVVPAVDLMCRIVGAHIPFNVVNSVPAIEDLVSRGTLSLKEDMLSLADSQESYVHFCVSLVAPLMDSLSVLCSVMSHLVPGTRDAEIDLNAFIVKCMETTKQELTSGHLYYPFVANTQLMRNNVDGLIAANVLNKRREDTTILISLAPGYQDASMLSALQLSIDNMRVDISKFPTEMHSAYRNDVDVTDEMIGLMVDVVEKKKRRKH